MRRLSTLWLAMTWLVAGMPHALAGYPSAIPARATLNSITVADPSVGREVLLRIDGKYSFNTFRTPEGALYVDLQGARVGGVSPSAHWASGLLAGYRLIEYTDASGEPVVRVEIQTRGQEPLIAVRESSGLRLLLGQSAPASGTPTPPAKEAGPPPGETTEGPALVSDIMIRPGSSGEVTIDVATTKSATFHVFQFDHPDRLVVDLEGARNQFRQKSIPVSSPVVKDVRVGQFQEKNPEVVRVVADLSGKIVFDAHAYAGGVRIEVKPRPMAAPPAVAPAPAPKLDTAAKRDERKLIQQAAVVPARQVPAPPAHPAASAAPELQTAVVPTRPSAAVSFPARTEKTPQREYNVILPASEGSREVAAAPRQTPHAATPEALRAERSAQVLSVETASNLSGVQGTVPASSASPSEQKPAYTGELISLNLKDVDLKDFFRLIHEISGLNILVDPNVTGSVTTVLDNVPWDQALDVVLKDNGLGKVLEGNVLRIARLETLMAEDETANKMAAARLDEAPLVTVFRPLNYAKASIIAPLLLKKVGKEDWAVSRRGSVLFDERTNTLIIRDLPSQIPIIDGILAKLDTKTKQVAIETRIVLANSSFQRTLSAALVGALSNRSGSTSAAGQTGSAASVTPSTPGTSPPTFTIPANAASGFGTVAITNFSQRYMIDAAISAAEIRSQAKTISRPSIITQNNVEGMVQQGTQIPVQTSINNTIAIQYVNATLQLTVTPQVTDDGHIFLKIAVQNASPGTIVTNAAVSINLQQATTQVLVPDGGTVVFGGVTVTQRSNSSTGIPLLGDIPLLGHLFKSTNVQDTDQELLFFVSPRLLTT
jgi:type IV pilus secretin PilQ/predicted competence protein